LERKVAALDEQPFVAEMTLIDQTLKFCKDLLPQEEGAAKEEKKETVHNNKDNEVVLMKKEDRDEEFFFAPTAKKKGKKGSAAKADAPKAKPIKHNAETFKLFDSLKLDAPITTADVPALIGKLEAQKADYEKKVEDWKQNKEEMKRKIMEGTINPDDLDEKGKEKKAEEKEEEKEEEKNED